MKFIVELSEIVTIDFLPLNADTVLLGNTNLPGDVNYVTRAFTF